MCGIILHSDPEISPAADASTDPLIGRIRYLLEDMERRVWIFGFMGHCWKGNGQEDLCIQEYRGELLVFVRFFGRT